MLDETSERVSFVKRLQHNIAGPRVQRTTDRITSNHNDQVIDNTIRGPCTNVLHWRGYFFLLINGRARSPGCAYIFMTCAGNGVNTRPHCFRKTKTKERKPCRRRVYRNFELFREIRPPNWFPSRWLYSRRATFHGHFFSTRLHHGTGLRFEPRVRKPNFETTFRVDETEDRDSGLQNNVL